MMLTISFLILIVTELVIGAIEKKYSLRNSFHGCKHLYVDCNCGVRSLLSKHVLCHDIDILHCGSVYCFSVFSGNYLRLRSFQSACHLRGMIACVCHDDRRRRQWIIQEPISWLKFEWDGNEEMHHGKIDIPAPRAALHDCECCKRNKTDKLFQECDVSECFLR